MLSSVKRIRNEIAKEVVEAGGNALRGLWHHLSMFKGAGIPNVLEKAVITETDLPSIQSFFRKKMQAQERELSKSQIQVVEVWAIDTFREMETAYKGQVPLMEYLKCLALFHNEYYVEAKNALLRTESELGLQDEEPIDPGLIDISSLENDLSNMGFNDAEDLSHIACLIWLKQNRNYMPIFATVDRKLYECKDMIYNRTGVIVDDALYAVQTYRSLTQKK